VEVSFEADLSGLPMLVGIIDLVRPGGKIVGFKTSAAKPQPARAGITSKSGSAACAGTPLALA